MGTKTEDPRVETPDAELADDAAAVEESDAAEQASTELDPVTNEPAPTAPARTFQLPQPVIFEAKVPQFTFTLDRDRLPEKNQGIRITILARYTGKLELEGVEATLGMKFAATDRYALIPPVVFEPKLFDGDGPLEHEIRTTKLDDDSLQVECRCGRLDTKAGDDVEAAAAWQTHVRIEKIGPGWQSHVLTLEASKVTTDGDDRYVVDCSRCGRLHDVADSEDARQLAGEHWEQVHTGHQARIIRADDDDSEDEFGTWVVDCAACGELGDWASKDLAEEAVDDHASETFGEADEDVAGDADGTTEGRALSGGPESPGSIKHVHGSSLHLLGSDHEPLADAEEPPR